MRIWLNYYSALDVAQAEAGHKSDVESKQSGLQ
jgi:hypothetical protein